MDETPVSASLPIIDVHCLPIQHWLYCDPLWTGITEDQRHLCGGCLLTVRWPIKSKHSDRKEAVMFQGFSRLRLRHSKQPDVSPTLHRLHGNVYCAALNIHRISNSAMSAEAADRLFAALANIEDLARELDSSPADRADIVQWRQHLEAKAAELRAQTGHHEPLPHPQLQIDSAMLDEQLRRRATA